MDLIEDARELALLRLVRPGQFDCIYDVGANIGLHTIYYSHVARHVVAIEPHPANYARLLENISLNGRSNIESYDLALSDIHGAADFFIHEGVASQVNILSMQAGQMKGDFQKISVQTVCLDELGLAPPGLIKIDVEGAEMNVIRGARKCLQRHKPILHLEVHRANLHLFNTSEREIQDFLTDLGYSIEILKKGDEEHYIAVPIAVSLQ